MIFILFALGLIGLWIGAELVTKGSLAIAKRIGLSETFVGVTILALGTDLPEVIVSVTGAIEQAAGVETSGLVIGNIIGSTMGQITLVLGIAGLLKVLEVNKKDVITNGSVMIAGGLAFWLFAADGFLSPTDGAFLLVGYILYLLLLSNNERKLSRMVRKHTKNRIFKKDKRPLWWFVLQLIAGLALVAGASHVVINEGLAIAEMLKISQTLVGIIMIGVGTSLPELVVSVNAILRGSSGLSVGNLIGSNIVDILLALGLSSMMGGWKIARSIPRFDLPFLMVSSVVVLLFLLSRKKLERKESLLMLLLYYGYIILKLQGF